MVPVPCSRARPTAAARSFLTCRNRAPPFRESLNLIGGGLAAGDGRGRRFPSFTVRLRPAGPLRILAWRVKRILQRSSRHVGASDLALGPAGAPVDRYDPRQGPDRGLATRSLDRRLAGSTVLSLVPEPSESSASASTSAFMSSSGYPGIRCGPRVSPSAQKRGPRREDGTRRRTGRGHGPRRPVYPDQVAGLDRQASVHGADGRAREHPAKKLRPPPVKEPPAAGRTTRNRNSEGELAFRTRQRTMTPSIGEVT